MIRLVKTGIPAILAKNGAAWTKALLAAIANGQDPALVRKNQYNQPEIKNAIKLETHDKCAYCESDPLHVAYGDIEHIIPKSVDPAETYNWPNLTLACDICNTKKSDKEGLIDPYTHDPEAEFYFFGPMLFHKPGRFDAERTRRELDLNRTKLMERRSERLDSLSEKLERILATQDATQRAYLTKVLVDEETSYDKEYSACALAWVEKQKASGVI